MAIIEIKVPDIGDFAEVTVIELMVKVGDTSPCWRTRRCTKRMWRRK
jgi:hypothetical protein